MDNLLMEFKKTLSQNIHEAEKAAKGDNCKLCGKDMSSFCNSHSLPQMILRNISEYHRFNNSVDGLFPPLDNLTEFGLKNAGTFRSICNDCDNTMFQDYENEAFMDAIIRNNEVLSDKILAEIMLKTALLEHYKKSWSLEFYKILNSKYDVTTLLESDELNLKEYDDIIDKCHKIISDNSNNNFDLLYYDVLDHQAEIASQGFIALQKIPTQEIINDVFNLDPNYKIVDLLAICYPWKGKTLLMLICFKEDEKRFSPFIKYFNSLNLNSKRKLFQCMLFSLTEEVYLSERLSNEISKDKKITQYKINGLGAANAVQTSNGELDFVAKPPEVTLNGFRKAKLYI